MENLIQILGIFAVLVGLLIVSLPLAWVIGILKLFEVKEGTGTAFKLLGDYRYSAMSLKGFHFELDEFIVKDPGLRSIGTCWLLWRIGGWVFYIKWFVKPTKYTDQNDPDGFGEGYSVFLNQIQREFTLEKTETKQGEEIPLNLRTAFQMKVVNIYLFLFIAPKDVIAQVTKIIEAIMRGWVKSKLYNEIQEVKSNGGRMWEQFGADDPLSDIKASIKKIRDDWGIEILRDSISIMNVGLLEEDQKAFAEKKRQKLRTVAGAQELLGGMLENEAFSMGLEDSGKAIEELQKTTEGRNKLEAMVAKANQVVTQRALGVKPNLFGNADGSSLEPITATIASLISLAKGINSGSSPSGGSTESSSEKKGERGGSFGENYTQEEIEKSLEEKEVKDS